MHFRSKKDSTLQIGAAFQGAYPTVCLHRNQLVCGVQKFANLFSVRRTSEFVGFVDTDCESTKLVLFKYVYIALWVEVKVSTLFKTTGFMFPSVSWTLAMFVCVKYIWFLLVSINKDVVFVYYYKLITPGGIRHPNFSFDDINP